MSRLSDVLRGLDEQTAFADDRNELFTVAELLSECADAESPEIEAHWGEGRYRLARRADGLAEIYRTRSGDGGEQLEFVEVRT